MPRPSDPLSCGCCNRAVRAAALRVGRELCHTMEPIAPAHAVAMHASTMQHMESALDCRAVGTVATGAIASGVCSAALPRRGVTALAAARCRPPPRVAAAPRTSSIASGGLIPTVGHSGAATLPRCCLNLLLLPSPAHMGQYGTPPCQMARYLGYLIQQRRRNVGQAPAASNDEWVVCYTMVIQWG